MRIYIAADRSCLTEKKEKENRLGGTELFCLLVEKYLVEAGHDVERTPRFPQGDYDLAFHLNVFFPMIKAKKHCLWAGSYHASGREHVDVVMCNSEYCRERLNWPEAEISYPPYNHEILCYADSTYLPGVIVTTSNPNRHFPHTVNIARKLEERGVIYEIHCTSGNKLYCDSYGDCYSFVGEPGIRHLGVLKRLDVFRVISGAHIWMYPNLSDDSESFCVAAIEAAVLGIPTIVPAREPFLSIMPELCLCKNEAEFADAIEAYLENRSLWVKPERLVKELDDRVLMPRLVKRLEEIENA